MLQVVFRKIADVQREKELAERDRHDPPVELSTDHPVRRLISRFRKMSCGRVPPGTGGMPLSDLSPSHMLTVDTPLHALADRKTHSIDATNCSTLDVCNRPFDSDTTTNNNCIVSNGGTGVSTGRAAWGRLLSRASSFDINAATAAAVTTLPSNSDNTLVINSSTTGNTEERALLSDNVVPRTPRSK